MFNLKRSHTNLLGVTLLFLLTAACAGTATPVRHLSSDVCLVMPEKTTREEVISFLGEPDQKMTTAENQELWLYLKANKSFLRKMPMVGDQLGTEDYETVTVTFAGDRVRTCLYRQLSESEFKEFNTELP